MPSKKTHGESRIVRRLALVSSATLILSVAWIVAWLFAVHRTVRSSGYALAATERASLFERQHHANLAKALALRDSWKGWAQGHADLLRAMLKGGDQAACDRVYAALPTVPDPSNAGFRASALSGGPSPFTWPAFLKVVRPRANSTPVDAEHYANSVKNNLAKREATRERYHDMEISQSMNGGPHVVSLYASGRVTVTETVEQHTPGKPLFVDLPPVEAQPPYEFLR